MCSPGIKILHDNIKYHNLRSIDLLSYFGFDLFTYPHSWRVYNADFTPYRYILDKNLNSMDLPKFLVCITNQHYEESFSVYSIKKTINSFLANPENTLILVLDKSDLEIKGKFRPLDQEPFINCNFSFEEIYSQVKGSYKAEQFEFIFHNSKNLFFQDMTILVSEISNEDVKNFKEIFENIYKFPYLPIWSFFTESFGRKGEKLYATKNELKRIITFFRRRVEVSESIMKGSLRLFLDEIISNLDFIEPIINRKKVRAAFLPQIKKFAERVKNIEDELLRNRLIKYIEKYL